MLLRIELDPNDFDALRKQAAREGRSLQQVAVLAIRSRCTTDLGTPVLDDLFDAAAAEDRDLLRRLAR